VHEEWSTGGLDAIAAMLEASPRPAPPDGPRRVLVHASGFRQSPYADIKPADAAPAPARQGHAAPSKLWHSSPGSSGW
jgi:error-prone DNA polymerase